MRHMRKFYIALLAIISASILCGFGKISASMYMSVITTVVAMYKISNVAKK